MKKAIAKVLIIGLIVLALLILLCVYIILSAQTFQKRTATLPQVCFREYCFLVELADTAGERTQGLMNRSYLAPDRGMLFVFNRDGQYSFWMKNTLIPLDIIWINQDHKVVFISADTQPCRSESCPSITPPQPARFVLELNAGATEKIGLNIGDALIF